MQQVVSWPYSAREEDRVNVLDGGLDAHGLQIRRYRFRQWGDLRFGELGKRPDLTGRVPGG